jgi:DNA-binding NarL/FixJ family response regulator
MRLAVVDDHSLFRIGIRATVSARSGVEIVGEASTAQEALKLAETVRPDVFLMDIGLAEMDGVRATREIKRRCPDSQVLIVTAHADINNVLDALDAGASGFLLKTEPPEAVLEALMRIEAGERYLSPGIGDIIHDLVGRPSAPTEVTDVLSRREREVFRLAARCLNVKEIATELDIARKTVHTHLHRITHKLGLRNLAELVRLAANLGMALDGRAHPGGQGS